jgi:Na+/proline symporter
MFFNFAHYALRPWPWILVALASLIVFPDLASLKTAFPHLSDQVINDDLAYPAMMTFLPHGLLGLVLASLIAAFMSTISTQLNWGSSYVVNDFYKRFIKPEASEKELVNVGRISTVSLMVLAGLVALEMESALGAFNVILQIGAGTGLIFILRWFWWRINAWSEVAAMIVSFLVALYFEFLNPEVATHVRLLSGIAVTTAAWLAVTFLTQPTEHTTLLSFYKLIKPHASGWQAVIQPAISSGELKAEEVTPGKLPLELVCMVAGCFLVYGVLFGVGFFLYGDLGKAMIGLAVALITGFILVKSWSKVKGND